MCGIEVFVVLTLVAFHLAVVSWRIDLDAFVPDTELFERFLKQCGADDPGLVHAVREFRTIIRLRALNGIGKLLCAMPDELGRRIGTVSPERFRITKSAEFVTPYLLA